MRSGGSPSVNLHYEDADVRRQQLRLPTQRAALAAKPAAASGGAHTEYRVVYSSDDSISDGELHVQQRAGSLTAWYQRGAAPAHSQQRAARPVAADSDSDDSNEGEGPMRSSVTVVLHKGQEVGEDSKNGEGGSGSGGVPVSKQELEDMITWETNNLFDYLKGLYQQGAEEAQQGQEFDRWVLAQ